MFQFQDLTHQDALDISSSVRVIGPDEAAQMIQTMTYEHQRNVNKAQVQRLATEMLQGRFLATTAIILAHYQDRTLLIDGQHRLHAVVLSRKPQVFTVIEHITETAERLAWLYGNTDNGRARKPADLFRPLQLKDQTGLSDASINILATAVEFLANNMMYAKAGKGLSKAQKAEYIVAYAPYMQQYLEATRNATKFARKASRRGYVVAVALLSFAHTAKDSPEMQRKVVTFWQGAVGATTTGQDARKGLYEHLVGSVMTTGNNSIGADRIAMPVPSSRYVIKCFNNYMDDVLKIPKLMRNVDIYAPIKMIGVPADPKQWLV